MSLFRPFLPQIVLAALLALTWCDVRAQSNGMWIDRFGSQQGLNGGVNAIAVADSGVLYVGGSFTEAGGKVVNHIAKWTGSTWEGLGAGVEDYVNALALTPSGALYVGGDFIEADGKEARFVALWTGETWQALEGLHGRVFAVAANDTSLFAGGQFGSTNEGPVYRLAHWDGASWRDVGQGVRGPFGIEDDALVYALALGKQGLYVGGLFLEAGGQPARNIALWDGLRWHSLGVGAGDGYEFVSSIAASDSAAAYVGGQFVAAGGQVVNNVARWTGTTWEPLGIGVNGPVAALALGTGGEVYVGGYFTEAGGLPASNIARWTGTSWEPLGSGVDLYGSGAIDIRGQDVYVGGNFTMAGGINAGNLALWRDSSPTSAEATHPEDQGFLQFDVVYPNPTIDECTLVFRLGQPAPVRLQVYNLLGQRMAILLDSMLSAGTHKVLWRTADLTAGSYLVRLQAGSSTQTRSVTLAR